MKKITLIYGGGTMGSFLACCLNRSGHTIFFLTRGKQYKKIIVNGLEVKIFNNSNLKKIYIIKSGDSFNIIENIKDIKGVKFNNIFITTSINESLVKTFKAIEPFVNKKTLIVTPCTAIPFWWHECLKNNFKLKFKKKLEKIFAKNIKRKNLVGMTMWLSGKIEKPGKVKISHIQRGLPIKEIYSSRKKQVDLLRNDIKKNCRSPIVINIFSEIFIKSLNSLAFNFIALKYNENNKMLSQNKKAKNDIKNILEEGDVILKYNSIKIPQSPKSRIDQTLSSSKHTMSMLNSVNNNKKTELKALWKSFEKISKIFNHKMSFTKKNIIIVKRKINEYF